MTWVLAVAIGAVAAAGVYLALSRHLLRCVIGISLIGTAANLVMFAAGRPGTSTPPLVPLGEELLTGAANPLPQALVLTAIVIGFSVTCFSLVLALALQQGTGESDSDAVRLSEPPEGPGGKPALEEEEQA